MKDRLVLFNGAMVRAILAGTKTQTRRVVKLKNGQYMPPCERADPNGWKGMLRLCPYGQPGDRLWVRETWMDLQGTGIEVRTGDRSRYAYGADTPPGSYGDEQRKSYGLKWRPSIHMPRAASRITLQITSVRVERLNDIAVEDAEAEGCKAPIELVMELGCKASPTVFRRIWEQINGSESWDANPWVWAIEFKRLEQPA